MLYCYSRLIDLQVYVNVQMPPWIRWTGGRVPFVKVMKLIITCYKEVKDNIAELRELDELLDFVVFCKICDSCGISRSSSSGCEGAQDVVQLRDAPFDFWGGGGLDYYFQLCFFF